MSNSILLLYGSQTGTAKSEAEQFCLQLTELGATTMATECDQCALQAMTSHALALFLVSTTGQGDPPFNMRKFWNAIFEELPLNFFSGLNFSVFGFGDSSYSKYNFTGKILAKRLELLGGKPIVPIFLGNENEENGWLENLRDWKIAVIDFLGKIGILKEIGKQELNCILSSPKNIFDMQITIPLKNEEAIHPSILKSNEQVNCILIGKILQNARLTSQNHFQRIYDLRIENPKKTSFSPGDLLYIYYENSDENISKLAQYLAQPLDLEISFKLKEKYKSCFPLEQKIEQMSIFALLKFHIDFVKPPNFSFVKKLSNYTEETIFREKLESFSFEEYYDYVLKEKRSLWEIFFDFGIKKIDFEEILNNCPRIRPREFSIASSFKADPTTIRIIYGVVEYQTPLKSSLRRKNKGTLHDFHGKPNRRKFP